MKAIIGRVDVPALVVIDADAQRLPGGVSVPSRLLNDLQRAQLALDQAEVALAHYLESVGRLDEAAEPLVDPHYRGRFA